MGMHSSSFFLVFFVQSDKTYPTTGMIIKKKQKATDRKAI